MSKWRQYHSISGSIVMIGFGSIGKGTLPLIDRHFDFDRNRLIVIDPNDQHRDLAESYGATFIQKAITFENYRDVLMPLLNQGHGQDFCVNLSVDTSSLDLMRLCREFDVLYIDTVIEPWSGFYFDDDMPMALRTNYALRETVLTEKAKNPGGTTAISCCGANPGMVNWFVKQALIDIAHALNNDVSIPDQKDRIGWARLMQQCGIKGIHIAEKDTQLSKTPKPLHHFWNTWSVEGFLSEGLQPAELGWGTHETWMPDNAFTQEKGCKSAIYLSQPGANTRVRSWCPTPGAQYGYLVTHNESVSIADYFTLGDPDQPAYRPTCHYAYHPADCAVLSLEEMFGNGGTPQQIHKVIDENEIISGIDELGVLLYGHAKNAYWYGSQLSIEQTRALAPHQNATGLQVSSAVLAGMVWALENPKAGIVDTDHMDFSRCLEVQKPYLEPVKGFFTDWTPLQSRNSFFPEDMDESDPWQFKNILLR
jgi:homospermidine synthase